MKANKLLIIFYRNPELGKVKTRLAVTVGDTRALAIYKKLAEHTCKIATEVRLDRVVYYSHFVDVADDWRPEHFEKTLQQGETLGDKMSNAFKNSFEYGYQSVCIIGTDCLELTSDVIEQAFASLETSDAVIGPAKDGGYYLVGMKKYTPALFLNKQWSTSSVAQHTIEDFEKLKLNYYRLPVLSDVDYAEDLPEGWDGL